MTRRLLFVVNDAAFFCSHRLPLALAAREAGWQVSVACPLDGGIAPILENGIIHFPIPLGRGKLGPLGELRAIVAIDRVFARYRPDLAHLITSKPIIYGGLVARRRRVATVSAVSGLGHVFIDDGSKARVLRRMAMAGYRLAMRRPRSFTIFQNADNLALFRELGAVSDAFAIIRGSGTDLSRFDPAPVKNRRLQIILPARMLYSKGVGEFVEAARLLQLRGVEADFRLVGDGDPANPATVPADVLREWHASGIVIADGYRPDIAQVLKSADIVVLPSHNEGFPKSLVDAAAAGRAVVTTDVPGCRDAIVAGETGLLVPARDPVALAAAIQELIADPARRRAFGAAGRSLAERDFAIESIVAQHLAIYDRMVRA
jgi:glycosyltransferase involved in cell wall biosynthesis